MSTALPALPALDDPEIRVAAGEVVALLGSNGAGKTSRLLAMAGVAPSGDPGTLHRRARAGLALVTADRSLLPRLSVADNLRLGGVAAVDVVARFPELAHTVGRRAGDLDAAEQRTLALGLALARRPRLLLCDELAAGVAPAVAMRLFEAVRWAANAGAAVVVAEQHAHHALAIADRVVVLRHGHVDFTSTAAEAWQRIAELETAYLHA